MSSWDKLPAEIIIKIAKKIDSRKDIIQFQLTCKSWAPLAQQRLYADIKLTTEFQLRVFTKNMTSNPSLGLFVERLHISGIHYVFKHMNDFSKWTEYCPNIRQILATCRIHKRFWQLLIRALQEGKWRQLHLIEPPITSQTLVDYGQAVWEIRDKLTELRISDELHQIEAWPGEGKESSHSVAEKILAFPKVQDLTLIKRPGYMHIFDFNEHIDNCVSLKKLKIQCFLPPYQDPVKNRQFAERRMLSGVSTIKQQHAVKQLCITLPLFRDDSLTYIMQKFPSLSALNLYTVQFINTERSTSLSYEVCHEFLEYISKIQSVNIDRLEIKDVCELLPITFNNRIKLNKRKTVFIINYINSPRKKDSSILRIKIDRSYGNSNIEANRLCSFRDQTKCNYSIRIDFFAPEHYTGSNLPHVTLIESLGNEMTTLQLDCKAKTEVFMNIARGYFLDHILANCSRLEDLDLIGAFLLHCSSTLPVKKCLNTLSLRRCDVYPGFFSGLSPLLPLLGILHLDNCKFISEDGQQLPKQSYLTVNMPHTSIDCLRLSFSANYDRFSVNLKLRGEKEKYFVIANRQYPTLSTVPKIETSYRLNDDLNDEHCFIIDIECSNLKKLHITGSACMSLHI
jgi:hypothetical protein